MNRMKSFYFRLLSLTLVIFSSVLSSRAAAPYEVEWVSQIGTPDWDGGFSAVFDTHGNPYVSGYTYGNLEGVNAGRSDPFLAKYDSTGNLLWIKQYGTASDERTRSLAIDPSENTYICGTATSSSIGTLTDGFISKQNSSGELIWSKRISASSYDHCNDVALDGFQNIYIAGSTDGEIEGEAHAGGKDAYLSKLDNSGNHLWTFQFGTSTYDEASSVAVDNSGNAFVVGSTDGTLGKIHHGGGDSYLSKIDSSGNLLWTEQIGTEGFELGFATEVDDLGNVYVAGTTTGRFGSTRMGSENVFLAKYDGAGKQLWIKQTNVFSTESIISFAVDSSGNSSISGRTNGDLEGKNMGGVDAYILKYSPAGNLLGTEQLGSFKNDVSYAVALDNSGNALITGYTTGDLEGTNKGSADVFLAMFSTVVPEPSTAILTFLSCTSIITRRRKR